MATSLTIDDSPRIQTRESGRKTNPLRPTAVGNAVVSDLPFVPNSMERPPAMAAAVARQLGQLPAYAPLLDELEIAGWSSHRRMLSGNFHDWLILEDRLILVAVGQALGPEPFDPIEAALVAQATWATIRAHAHHVRDAGDLLSITSRSLWPVQNSAVRAAMAIALLDTAEGRASVAMAGNCLAWRIRASSSEQLAINQPMLGEATDFTYRSQVVQLSLRERLLLVADNPLHRSPKLPSSIAADFASLDAESHRRMMATDVLALVRHRFEQKTDEPQSPASIVAVRRR